MADIPTWVPVVISLASLFVGGLAGAIYNQRSNDKKSEPQPIEKNITLDPVLRPRVKGSELKAKITIYDQGNPFEFSNLFVVFITITNKGNKDLSSYKFGVKLRDGDGIAYMESAGPTLDHEIKASDTASPSSLCNRTNFTCKPLNRGDSYGVTLYIVADTKHKYITPSDISVFSSESGTKLVDRPVGMDAMMGGTTHTTNYSSSSGSCLSFIITVLISLVILYSILSSDGFNITIGTSGPTAENQQNNPE